MSSVLRLVITLLALATSAGLHPAGRLVAQPIPAPAGLTARSTHLVASVVMPTTMLSSTSPLMTHEQDRCDGSAIRSASSRRGLGVIIGLAGVAISALAFNVTETTMTQFGPVVEQSVSLPRLGVGLVTVGVGTYLYYGKKADANAWDTALNSLKIGTSTPSDVTACLGKPRLTALSKSGSGDASILTYYAKSQGINQMYRLTFTNGLLANIEKTASK